MVNVLLIVRFEIAKRRMNDRRRRRFVFPNECQSGRDRRRCRNRLALGLTRRQHVDDRQHDERSPSQDDWAVPSGTLALAKRLAKALGLRGGTLLLAYGMAVWGVLTDRPRRATLRALRRAFQRPRDQTASVDGSSRRCGTARPFQSARRDRACDSRRTRPRRSPARASSDRAPARRPVSY